MGFQVKKAQNCFNSFEVSLHAKKIRNSVLLTGHLSVITLAFEGIQNQAAERRGTWLRLPQTRFHGL